MHHFGIIYTAASDRRRGCSRLTCNFFILIGLTCDSKPPQWFVYPPSWLMNNISSVSSCSSRGGGVTYNDTDASFLCQTASTNPEDPHTRLSTAFVLQGSSFPGSVHLLAEKEKRKGGKKKAFCASVLCVIWLFICTKWTHHVAPPSVEREHAVMVELRWRIGRKKKTYPYESGSVAVCKVKKREKYHQVNSQLISPLNVVLWPLQGSGMISRRSILKNCRLNRFETVGWPTSVLRDHIYIWNKSHRFVKHSAWHVRWLLCKRVDFYFSQSPLQTEIKMQRVISANILLDGFAGCLGWVSEKC